MLTIGNIIDYLETIAPPAYQESYDNAGLLTGSRSWQCSGALCTLDVTEAVIEEAVALQCNLVIAHHPIIFGGIKKLSGNGYVERTVIAAIKNDVAVFAIHTNLDNVLEGVSGYMAQKLGLLHQRVLAEKQDTLAKLAVFVPQAHTAAVQDALFKAGAGHIGNYSECSFNVMGTGTFKAGENTKPFVGDVGQRHAENEMRVEVIFPAHRQRQIIQALTAAHPYEEVAYDLYAVSNTRRQVGSGVIGSFHQPMNAGDALQLVKDTFGLHCIKHTPFTGLPVTKVALCGGAGSFLIKKAIAAGADLFITGDVKYHEFFDADGKIVVADIGHWESEQYTIELLNDVLAAKFPTFAVQKSKVNTNPVHYFV